MTKEAVTEGASNANIIYILYLVSILVGFTSIVGVVMAYLNRGQAADWVRSHYTFQIYTFWIGLLLMVIGAVLSIILIGWLILACAAVWWIIRCIKGMQWLSKNEPVPDPTSWLFG